MAPLLQGGGQRGGCPRSTQPLWGNHKPPYEATPCGSYSRPGASPSPHARCSGRSTAPHTGAGTDASGEAWLHRTRGHWFPLHHPTGRGWHRGCSGRRVLLGRLPLCPEQAGQPTATSF